MTATPFARVDHVVIAVRDLDAAASAYGDVLGLAPSWRGTHPSYGTANVLFGLANCYVELLALAGNEPTHPVAQLLAASLSEHSESLFALALGSDDLTATVHAVRAAGLAIGDIADGEGHDAHGALRRWRSCVLSPADTRGVTVLAIQHATGSALPPALPTGEADAIVSAVDHVVMFSDDLTAALALWRDRLGLREAWRRDFPERGTVNVGLRLGGVTLELVAPLAATGGDQRGERLCGLAYRVADCDAAVTRLRARGLAVSDARQGLAPNTRVATVKWQDRLPTLLLQPR